MSVAILDVPPAILYVVGAVPQTDFVVPFPFGSAADLRVLVAGGDALWSLITGAQDSGLVLTATVRLASPRTNTIVSITRAGPLEQQALFPTAGAFSTRTLNRELSRLWMGAQDTARSIQQTIRAPLGDAPFAALPTAVFRANTFPAFDVEGALFLLPLSYAGGAGGGGGGGGYTGTPPPGSIGADMLGTSLRDRINLIDGGVNIAGSVNARLRAEELARQLLNQTLGAMVGVVSTTQVIANAASVATAALAVTTEGVATAISAVQSNITTQGNMIAGNSTAITVLQAAGGSASALTSLTATLDSHTASIASLLSVNTTQSASITTLSTTTGQHTSALVALAAVDAVQGATYTLKTDVGGKVVGFGLINNGTTSGNAVVFSTDNFRIQSAGGGPVAIPFEVQSDGVVRIKQASIGAATIDSLRLADGSVITGKLSLNAASEPFSFYTADQISWQDTVWHVYAAGTIVVPAGGSAYLFARAQGFSYTGSAFVFRVRVNGVVVSQLPNPATNFAAGLQTLQETIPQIIVLGAGTQYLEIIFQGLGSSEGANSPIPIIGHIVGFIQKR